VDESAFDGIDVAVNLGGVPVAPVPWTTSRREQILSSRVNSTRTMAQHLAARAGSGRRTLIQQSGIARYGTTSGAEPYTEESPAAPDFLAQPAADAGVRVVILRTSPVMDSSGGSFPFIKLGWWCGLGATLGNGSQHMPMISLRDYLAVVQWAGTNEEASGPYNLTLPQPTTNAEFTDTLAAALHRPRFLRVPTVIIRTALGELAEQMVADQHVLPHRLTTDGFDFGYPTVEDTVTSALRA
jgi:uncharacterized protein (TIGR01777 family)